MLDHSDGLLMLVGAFSEERGFGRTSLQKLTYFCVQDGAIEPFGHAPYYYGPYSRMLENELSKLVQEGLVEEQCTTLGLNSKGFSVRRYHYSLTELGQSRVEGLEAERPAEVDELRTIGAKLAGVTEGLDQHRLSLAAKVDYLRRTSSLAQADIKGEARTVGWTLTDESVKVADGVLSQLAR